MFADLPLIICEITCVFALCLHRLALCSGPAPCSGLVLSTGLDTQQEMNKRSHGGVNESLAHR